MSLHSHLIKETRSLIIASASGLLLSTQTLPAQIPEKVLPEVRTSTNTRYQEPALLKITEENSHPLFSISDGHILQVQNVQQSQSGQRVQRLYGNQAKPAPANSGSVQPVQIQPVLQTPPKPIQQTAGSRVPRKSLFDRLVGKIKGDSEVPAGPPQDPGMDYTTVTEAKLQKTQAPQLVQQNEPIPSVEKFTPPPVPGVEETTIANVPAANLKSVPDLPRSFPSIAPMPEQKEETVEVAVPKKETPAIANTFIPPLPGSDEPANLAQGEKTESFPELKAIMEEEIEEAVSSTPETSQAAIPVVQSKPKARPLLDLNGPLPLLEDVLKAEKADEKLADASEVPKLDVVSEAKPIEVPAPESVPAAIAEVEIVEEVMVEEEGVAPPMPSLAETAIDPLANPFPEDVLTETAEDDLNAELLKMSPLEEVSPEPDEVVAAPPMPAEPELDGAEVPYSGLALEEDLFLKGKVPAPAEPSSILGSNSTPTTEEEVTDEKPGLASLADTAMPELPPFPSLEEEQPESSVESDTLTPSTEIPQLQTPESEQQLAMAAPPLQPTPQPQIQEKQNIQQSKMELIASRQGLSGLKGFCPVQLRDTRELVDVNENYSAIFNNKKYSFSNAEALQKFIADPEKYAPAMHGSDIIHLSLTGEEIEGSLDYAVWFKGRLYLFSSVETMETFVAAPNSHTTDL